MAVAEVLTPGGRPDLKVVPETPEVSDEPASLRPLAPKVSQVPGSIRGGYGFGGVYRYDLHPENRSKAPVPDVVVLPPEDPPQK